MGLQPISYEFDRQAVISHDRILCRSGSAQKAFFSVEGNERGYLFA